LRVLRVYHAGRDSSHRARERALAASGAEVTLVVPTAWEPGGLELEAEPAVRVIELEVSRSEDVNRHRYKDGAALRRVIEQAQPELLDIHEEPFSIAARQWLRAAPPGLPAVLYTAQNIDKRFPPPFSKYERSALARASGLYPCSHQAASVVRGKGFRGLIDVIPLGFDPSLFRVGQQSLTDPELVLGLFGRLVREKGVRDAVFVLERLNSVRPARLVLVGSGPESSHALRLATDLGLDGRVELHEWAPSGKVAEHYRRCHLVLVPSTATVTWAEQFGRVIVEAQACGAVVVGYASGSIPEVGGEAAVLVPEGRVDQLADAVVEVTTDEAAWARRRTLSEELAATRTWRSVAARQLDLYQRVLANPADEVLLPRGRAARRKHARQEFGPPATTPAGDHPFAIWPLRNGGRFARLLEGAVDLPDLVLGRALPLE
jgi:glycosyltransferase involved in cell wall biosynthesis